MSSWVNNSTERYCAYDAKDGPDVKLWEMEPFGGSDNWVGDEPDANGENPNDRVDHIKAC